jgi:hypothetical protein
MTEQKSIIDRMATAKQLWALALPWCPVQTDAGLYRWCDRFSDSEIEATFQKTSRKFFRRQTTAQPIDVYKYVSATLVHCRRDAEAALAQTAQEARV